MFRLTALVFCLVFAGLPTVFAILCWCTHAYQLWTDSIPLVPLTPGMLAKTLTKLALICWAAVGIAWWLTSFMNHRRAECTAKKSLEGSEQTSGLGDLKIPPW